MTNKNTKPSFTEVRNKQYARRQKKNITGPMQMIGSVAGTIGGAFLGGPLGAGVGASVGSALGNGIGWITGTGDYKVQANACTVPGFRNADSTVITHREYITDIKSGALVNGSTAFTVSSYPINPGASATFPWLSCIAANYEEYEILGMVFAFVATSGESVASSNTSLGTVIMASQYDPTKPAFATKQNMENYHFSTSAKPSHNQMHAIECKKVLTPVKQLYIRTGATVGDLRWTDFANFYIATVGCQAAGINLGELWVTYKVRLSKPRLPITTGLGGQIASQVITRSGGNTANPLGTTTVAQRGSIPTGDITVSNTSISFKSDPKQNYLVQIYAYGTLLGGINDGTIVNGVKLFINKAAAASAAFAVSATEAMLSIVVESTSQEPEAVIIIPITLNSTTHSIDVLVTQVDETLTYL